MLAAHVLPCLEPARAADGCYDALHLDGFCRLINGSYSEAGPSQRKFIAGLLPANSRDDLIVVNAGLLFTSGNTAQHQMSQTDFFRWLQWPHAVPQQKAGSALPPLVILRSSYVVGAIRDATGGDKAYHYGCAVINVNERQATVLDSLRTNSAGTGRLLTASSRVITDLLRRLDTSQQNAPTITSASWMPQQAGESNNCAIYSLFSIAGCRVALHRHQQPTADHFRISVTEIATLAHAAETRMWLDSLVDIVRSADSNLLKIDKLVAKLSNPPAWVRQVATQLRSAAPSSSTAADKSAPNKSAHAASASSSSGRAPMDTSSLSSSAVESDSQPGAAKPVAKAHSRAVGSSVSSASSSAESNADREAFRYLMGIEFAHSGRTPMDTSKDPPKKASTKRKRVESPSSGSTTVTDVRSQLFVIVDTCCSVRISVKRRC